MNKSALIKALTLSSVITTIALALTGGYSTNTTAEGITTQHYSFYWLWFYIPVFALFVFPTTFIVGFPFARLLYKFNAFNIYTVSIIGVTGAILSAMVIFSKYSLSMQLALPFGLGGLLSSTTAYFAYGKFNKALKRDTAKNAAPLS